MALTADIFFLTKNGGDLFKLVLRAAREQKTPWPYGITVIDSGSSDNTVAFCRQQNVRVVTIPPGDFQHGRTRNLAMTFGTGTFGVFITQDALPADGHWLRRLVEACDAAPDVAGAFGRHRPYPGCNPYVARDINSHFDRCATGPSIMRITDPARYRNDIPYRQQLHFFSDCNACIRRSVWSLYHYPEVDFGEDQAWAERILLAGFAKAYADDAVVLHSHELGIGETLRRAYDESAAYRRLFAYNLCPSPGVLFRQSWNLIRGDLRYARHSRLFTRAPVWTFKAPWLDLARMTGYYLGSREQRLPQWLRARLSGDQIKKRT